MRVYVEKRGPEGQTVVIVPARIARTAPVILHDLTPDALMDRVPPAIKAVDSLERARRSPVPAEPG